MTPPSQPLSNSGHHMLSRAQQHIRSAVYRSFLARWIRPRARHRYVSVNGQMFLEITIPCQGVPKTVIVEGRELDVMPIESMDQAVPPYAGGIAVYGAGFMGSVIVYTMVSAMDYCKAIFFTMGLAAMFLPFLAY